MSSRLLNRHQRHPPSPPSSSSSSSSSSSFSSFDPSPFPSEESIAAATTDEEEEEEEEEIEERGGNWGGEGRQTEKIKQEEQKQSKKDSSSASLSPPSSSSSSAPPSYIPAVYLDFPLHPLPLPLPDYSFDPSVWVRRVCYISYVPGWREKIPDEKWKEEANEETKQRIESFILSLPYSERLHPPPPPSPAFPYDRFPILLTQRLMLWERATIAGFNYGDMTYVLEGFQQNEAIRPYWLNWFKIKNDKKIL